MPKHVVIHFTLYSIINLLCLTCVSYIILYVILVIAQNGDEPPKKETKYRFGISGSAYSNRHVSLFDVFSL